MKRSEFIFVFMLSAFLVSGVFFSLDNNEKISTLGCGSPSTSGSGNTNSNPDCFFADKKLPENTVLTYFAPTELIAIQLTAAKMGITTFPVTPASFKVTVPGSNPSFAIRDGGTPPRVTRHEIASTRGDCALYTFPDRIQFSGSYISELDHRGPDPQTGEEKCYYKVIAGKLIDGFNDCPEIRDGVKMQECVPTKQCSYAFDKTYTYGYIVIADKAGCNPLVTPVQISDTQDAIQKALVAAADICKGVDSSSQNKCGNGILDADEECDDGNNVGGDGCSSDCKSERCTTNFGSLEVKGGIYNYLVGFVDDIRFVGYSLINAGFVQDKRDDSVLIYNAKTNLWIHKDLYSEKYDTFVVYKPDEDLFNLREYFPPKDWGSANSFYITVEATIQKTQDGKKTITLSAKYKKAPDSVPKPYDLSTFVISNPDGQKTETKEIKDESTNIRAVQKAIAAALKLYVTFHDSDLPATLYGVGPSGNKGGGLISNGLVDDWVPLNYLNGIDQDDTALNGKFDVEVVPKIKQSLEGKINVAKQRFPCKE